MTIFCVGNSLSNKSLTSHVARECARDAAESARRGAHERSTLRTRSGGAVVSVAAESGREKYEERTKCRIVLGVFC